MTCISLVHNCLNLVLACTKLKNVKSVLLVDLYEFFVTMCLMGRSHRGAASRNSMLAVFFDDVAWCVQLLC
jgi:hypothetical protein